jgi:hypothetical protein
MPLSPSADVRAVISYLYGKDIFAEFLTLLTGDWDAYERCAVVWHQIDGASTDMASNLLGTVKDLPTVWRGNLPTALEWALIVYARAFDNLAKECRYYSTAYEQASEAAHEFFEGFEALLEQIIDTSVLALAAQLTGDLLFETVIGEVVGSAVAAFYIARTIELCNEAYEQLQRFEATITLMSAAQTAFQSHQTWKMPDLIDGPRFQVIEHA